MFGFSIAKLLTFLAVALIVFVGWRKLASLGEAVERMGKNVAGGRGKKAKKAEPEIVDLVEDPETGSFEPRDNTRPHD